MARAEPSLHRVVSDTLRHFLLRAGEEGSERGEVGEGYAADTVEVEDGAAGYAPTFTFRGSTDACGTCTVAVRMADSHLRDSNTGAIGYSREDTVITIQAP